MKKILLALDGEHFPKGAFELLEYLSQKEPVLAAGIFLNPVDVSKMITYTGFDAVPLMPQVVEEEYEENVKKNIKEFENKCVAAHIEFRIHKDQDELPIQILVRESRFADMLFISSETFYANMDKQQPNIFMEEVLHKAECPVILAPENLKIPERIVFAYDGSKDAAFSIRQFAYLFPEFSNKRNVLLFCTKKQQEKFPEQDFIAELTARHFLNIELRELVLDKIDYFPSWLAEEEYSFVVLGSYAEGFFQSLFHKSFADKLIREIKMPLFITHR